MNKEIQKPSVNIIMPAFNAHNTIRQAIGSIVMQDDLDNILLTIVDDCSDEPYDYLLNDFHYMNIEIFRKPENTGCGQSRQYGIDQCKSQYFMFLDADDSLYTPSVVKTLYKEIIKTAADCIVSDFLEEINNEQYILHQNSGVWMHGKLFRTDFIKENNIRFNCTRINEDHAFNILVELCGAKSLYLEYKTYIWKNNRNSITRNRGNTYIYLTDNFIKNAYYILSEMDKRDISCEKYCETIIKYIYAFYRYYNEFLMNGVSKEWLENYYINEIKNFLKSTKLDFRNCITKREILKRFNTDKSVQNMIDNEIIFLLGVNEYIDMVT